MKKKHWEKTTLKGNLAFAMWVSMNIKVFSKSILWEAHDSLYEKGGEIIPWSSMREWDFSIN